MLNLSLISRHCHVYIILHVFSVQGAIDDILPVFTFLSLPFDESRSKTITFGR